MVPITPQKREGVECPGEGRPWQLPPSALSWEACWAKGPHHTRPPEVWADGSQEGAGGEGTSISEGH